jgi:hypothetical protein
MYNLLIRGVWNENRIEAKMCTKYATLFYSHRRHYKECKEKYKNLTVGKFKMKNVTLHLRITSENEEKLQQSSEVYQKELGKINMEVNIEKSKTMIIFMKERKHKDKNRLQTTTT